jgi:hypothetical protein
MAHAAHIAPPQQVPSRSHLQGALLLLVLGIVVFGAALATGNPWAGFAWGAAVAPVAIFGMLYSGRPNSGAIGLGPILITVYLLFFPLRALYLAQVGYANLVIPEADWDAASSLLAVLAGTGVAMICFVVGYFSPLARRIARKGPLFRTPTRAGARALWLGLAFIGLAYVGQGLLILEHHGFAGLAEQYASHNKLFEASSREKFALMLWYTFHSSGVWLIAAAYAEAVTSQRSAVWERTCVAVALIVGAVIATFAYGSRMQLFGLLAGVVIIYHWHVRRIKTWLLLLLAPALVIGSVAIVAWRTDIPIATVFRIADVSGNLGHGIFDVFLAIHQHPIPRTFVTSPARWAQIPLWLVPRFLWPSKPLMTQSRLDWLVADYYRGNGHILASTGFPASMFAEWYVLGGWATVVLAAFLFGTVAGAVDRWFSTHERSIVATLLYVSVAVALAFYFKDGDIVASALGWVKTVGLMFGVVLLIGGLPGKATAPE